MNTQVNTQLIGQRLFMAIPLALAWMPLTANISLESFLVGWVLSFAILTLLFQSEKPSVFKWSHLPDRIFASVVYMLILFRDIYLAAMDVAKRVIDPAMPMNPGILEVATQWQAEDTPAGKLTADTVAAVSAHGITITPGELVVDFDGNEKMYVHCLDVVASSGSADGAQAKRIALLRRILL